MFVYQLMRHVAGSWLSVALFCSLVLSIFATNKVNDVSSPAGIDAASSIITKCLAPLSSMVFSKPYEQPICSIQEFSSFSAEKLMKLDKTQIRSLPPSYFKSLKIEQAMPLSATFISTLNKEQAMAFPESIEEALPKTTRKLLNKIKRKPGPFARAVIMTLSALTAFIIFKYS